LELKALNIGNRSELLRQRTRPIRTVYPDEQPSKVNEAEIVLDPDSEPFPEPPPFSKKR
jgi:hypothetical protein